MTEYTIKKRDNRAFKILETLVPILTAILFVLTLCFSKDVSTAVIDGIRLAAFTIIPSIFPFFIFTDILNSGLIKLDGRIFARMFESLFGLNAAALGAFVCGNICGFPIGVGYASNLYTENHISKSECERLIAISNNPSLAFVISGVGLGLRGSIGDGVILYLSVIVSTVITGRLFKCDAKTSKQVENTRQSFDLATSIKNAAYSSITISSYIIFFSAVLGFISAIIKNKWIIAIISAFLEVGNAAKLLSKFAFLSSHLVLGMLAFALAFSGFSVHMQARSILHRDISMSVYYKMKLCEGGLAFITAILFSFVYSLF